MVLPKHITIYFFVAVFSNVFFSGRAVLSKVLLRSHPDCTNDISLFTHISLIGICIVTPFMFIFDVLPNWSSSGEVTDGAGDQKASFSTLILIYLVNGIAYTTYNLMSFMVLMRVNIATHAVLNVFRFQILYSNLYLCVQCALYRYIYMNVYVYDMCDAFRFETHFYR